MRRILLTLAMAAACGASGAATPPPVRAEIDALLARLAASGCMFQRNGSWYQGSEARAHLLRKLEYVEQHGTLRSTEQFIELAASTSSTSGKPYEVRCGMQPAQMSQRWLLHELSALRAAKPRGTP